MPVTASKLFEKQLIGLRKTCLNKLDVMLDVLNMMIYRGFHKTKSQVTGITSCYGVDFGL